MYECAFTGCIVTSPLVAVQFHIDDPEIILCELHSNIFIEMSIDLDELFINA